MATIRDNQLGYFELPASGDVVFRGRTTGDSSDAWSLTSGGAMTVASLSATTPYVAPHHDRPTSAIRASMARSSGFANVAPLSTGRLYMVAVHHAAGEVVTAISFLSATTALSGGTNQWAALFTSARVQLAVSADDTSTAWGASTVKTFTLSAPYTITATGLYYYGLNVTASTVPTLAGQSTLAAVTGVAPILSGYADASLTNPASCPATAAAITSLNVIAYAWST